jgi:FHA domain
MSALRYLLAPLAALLIVGAGEKPAEPKVADIRANVYSFLDERVRLEGFVTEYIDASAKTTAFYYLKDDWGGVVRVRTSGKAPAVGRRYSIIGPVGFDPRTQDPYISEEQRVEVGTPAPAPAGTKVQTAPTVPLAEPEPSSAWIAAIAGLGVVLAAIVVALFVVMRRSRSGRPSTADVRRAAAAPADAVPAPQQIVEGKTIKLHAPPPNTIKLLPAWLEVVAGDDVVRQVRFYKLRGDRDEFTFGRAEGRPYSHIQLKPMTVSSRQAKVEFSNGRILLTNLAGPDSNPTRLNGQELAVDQAVPLADKDVVEMGEVKFRFHGA